jgi:parallel beta-helix repeat protein
MHRKPTTDARPRLTPSQSLVILCVLCASAVNAFPASAGPLTPPAGPVAPTHKTLTEVEPRTPISAATTPGDADSVFKITQSGSYYLTGNVTLMAGKRGIEVGAPFVTIDLNGFTITGVIGFGLEGVSTAFVSLSSITVTNGVVNAVGATGIHLDGSNHRVSGVTARFCGAHGVSVGDNSIVDSCIVSDNADRGIDGGDNCLFSDSVANDNAQIGFRADAGSTIARCVAGRNGTGISTTDGCLIVECTSHDNTAVGIIASTACTVADCLSRFNVMEGIRCTNGCVISRNTCVNNGNGGIGAGIEVFGFDNRIEGNTCTGADRGISVNAGGNIIIRNTCSNNASNWFVVAGNVCLVVNAATTGANFSGDSGGAAPGSADPSANFTY